MGRKSSEKNSLDKKNYHATIIFGVVGVAGFIMLLIGFVLPYWHDHYAIEDTGLTYKNYPLGFQISRPNLDWLFLKDMGSAKIRYGLGPTEKSFLGGILVGRNTGENVFVVVFMGNDPEKQNFENYIKSEIKNVVPNYLVNFTTNYFVSPEKDWATFDTNGTTSDGDYYVVKQRLVKHNDKIYLLQATADTIELTNDKSKIELDQVYNSFSFIP